MTRLLSPSAWLLPAFACALHATATAGELTVANIAPFAGKLASSSRDFNLGLQACVADQNARGGFGGHALRVISRDDGQDAGESGRLAAELVSQAAPLAFVGPGSASAVARIASAVPGTPIVAPQSELPALDDSAAVFSLRPTRELELASIAKHLASMGIGRVGLIGRDDDSGQRELASARSAIVGRGLVVAASASIAPRSLDPSAADQAMRASSLQAIVVLTDTPTTAAFVARHRASSRSTLIIATSSTEAEALTAALGPVLTRGIAVAQVTPSPNREVTELARDFRDLMRRLRLPEDRITHGSMGGYLACRVLAMALAKSPGRDPTPQTLIHALASMKDASVGGFTVDFAADRRHGSRYVDLSIVGDGGRIRQ